MSRSRPLNETAGARRPAGGAGHAEAGRAGGGAAPAGLFSRINPGRISGIIVDQIRLLMREGHLQPGDQLPAERKLCEDFGVSRVTVREALRVLEANGLIEIRVGARGGAFVRSPSKERVGEGILDYLTMSSATAGDVTELRMVLELGIIPLVCERATDEDVEDLLALCHRAREALATGTYDMSFSVEFHARVAECAHNGAIELLLASLQGPLLMSLEEAQQVAPEMGRRGVQEHLAFVEAVRDRKADEAVEIMRAHLERTAARVRHEQKTRAAAARSGLRRS
jgi:GntR family transcriptional regulator, transcriptional repressor for pyruvate dehydrogenase complex